MKTEKLTEAIRSLSDIDESYDDIFEHLGVIVDDVADMLKSSTSREFTKQKSDARLMLKQLKRRIDNMTFKNTRKK